MQSIGFQLYMYTNRLYVEQYRLIQMQCGGTGVVGVTDDVVVTDVTHITDITDMHLVVQFTCLLHLSSLDCLTYDLDYRPRSLAKQGDNVLGSVSQPFCLWTLTAEPSDLRPRFLSLGSTLTLRL